MTSYQKMMLRSEAMGNTIREQMINNTREEIEALLEDDPSYKTAEVMGKGTIKARFNNYKIVNNTPQMDVQSSLSEDITINLGDVFLFDNGYWLCTDNRVFHDMYRFLKIEECNYLLKFQNKRTLEISSRWCVVKDPYASGVDEGKTVSLGNSKYKIKLPHDEETAMFSKDDRFLIDISNDEPIPYKLVRFDGITNRYESRKEGFLVISLDEDVLRDGDRPDLFIADYVEPPENSFPPVGSCKIVYSSEPIIKIRGSAKRFTALFKDSNDNPITTITPTWEIIPSELVDENQIVILSEIGNEIKLQATNKAKVGTSFILKMSATDVEYGEFEHEISIEVRGVI